MILPFHDARKESKERFDELDAVLEDLKEQEQDDHPTANGS